MPNTTVCPLAKKCGGCQLQNLSYPEQLHLKQATAIRLLGRFGHVEEILGMDDPYHYRNKVQAAFGVNRQGQIISGVYQSASHRIVPVSDCLIEDKVADRIIVTIRKLLKSFKIRPYDEDTGRGTLRHVLVRRGWRSGEILVVLVTAHGMLPGKRNFVRALLQRHPDITTIVQNINAGQTSLVLGPHSEVLYGPGYIREQLGDFTFRISPRAFYQINPVQTEVLYRTALDYAGLAGKETVVDAYCGTGTIGIFASRNAARVIGVENNRDAVRDAISNAKANRADNVRFYTADASDFLQGMARAGEHADVIILDPPRAGSDERFLAAVTAVVMPSSPTPKMSICFSMPSTAPLTANATVPASSSRKRKVSIVMTSEKRVHPCRGAGVYSVLLPERLAARPCFFGAESSLQSSVSHRSFCLRVSLLRRPQRSPGGILRHPSPTV